MENLTALNCPNCGAATTNYQNCEYCGSLLVRFVDKKIEINTTSYGKESFIFAGLETALKRNFDLQITSNGDFVCTDAAIVEIPNCSVQFVCSNQLPDSNGNLVFPTAKTPSISVNLYFTNQPTELRKFKQMDIFSLFTDISYDNTPMYAIDFGEDYIGAAQIFTQIAKEVYGATEKDECKCETWEYEDQAPTSQNSYQLQQPIQQQEVVKDNKVNSSTPLYKKWWFWCFVIAVFFLLFMGYVYRVDNSYRSCEAVEEAVDEVAYYSPQSFYRVDRKTYFHNTPNDYDTKKAYLIQGDEIFVAQVQNGFGYVEYTNSKGTVTKGWLKMDDLREIAKSNSRSSSYSNSQASNAVSNSNSWLIGTWEVVTREFGPVRMKIIDDRNLIFNGSRETYTVSGNTLRLGDGTPMELNRQMQTIDLGYGNYFRKIY